MLNTMKFKKILITVTTRHSVKQLYGLAMEQIIHHLVTPSITTFARELVMGDIMYLLVIYSIITHPAQYHALLTVIAANYCWPMSQSDPL